MAGLRCRVIICIPNPADDVIALPYFIYRGRSGQSCDIHNFVTATGRLLLERFELITGQQQRILCIRSAGLSWYTISVQTENELTDRMKI